MLKFMLWEICCYNFQFICNIFVYHISLLFHYFACLKLHIVGEDVIPCITKNPTFQNRLITFWKSSVVSLKLLLYAEQNFSKYGFSLEGYGVFFWIHVYQYLKSGENWDMRYHNFTDNMLYLLLNLTLVFLLFYYII